MGVFRSPLSPGETSINARRSDNPVTEKQFCMTEWVSIAVNYQDEQGMGLPFPRIEVKGKSVAP